VTTSLRLPSALDAAVRAELDAWRAGERVRRLWSRDATLWTGADEAAWLGRLDIPGEQLSRAGAVRNTFRVATCVGFGPRYLHSTGQAYKGGPNSCVFVQITCDDADDLAVPGQRYSFGVVKTAQALGDLQVLRERGRRALRVHLGTDVKAGLALLRRAIEV
jgi:transaldolase / glucose-6-phosphate isomerase